MAGESYTSPVTGETYTVPSYTDPADAPIAFKDFADTITGGIDFDPDRVGQVVQSLDGAEWDKGMALQVVDAVPDDTAGEVGDVVFIPGGLPIGGGKILQIVSAIYSVQTTTTSATYVTTGLTATITPSSATSKILVMASGNGLVSANHARGSWSILRGTVTGPAVGSRIWIQSSAGNIRGALSCIALDSPNTTSAQVYTLGMAVLDGGEVATQMNNAPSVMILMEVAA